MVPQDTNKGRLNTEDSLDGAPGVERCALRRRPSTNQATLQGDGFGIRNESLNEADVVDEKIGPKILDTHVTRPKAETGCMSTISSSTPCLH